MNIMIKFLKKMLGFCCNSLLSRVMNINVGQRIGERVDGTTRACTIIAFERNGNKIPYSSNIMSSDNYVTVANVPTDDVVDFDGVKSN